MNCKLQDDKQTSPSLSKFIGRWFLDIGTSCEMKAIILLIDILTGIQGLANWTTHWESSLSHCQS